MIISGNFTNPLSLFVTSNEDIYVDDGWENQRVQKWIAKTKTFVTVMKVNSICDSVFVDTNDTLYCSMWSRDQVVKRWLNDSDMTSIIRVAGTGVQGSAINQLHAPLGIFVDVNYDLYIADSENNRIQLWHLGESSGITVAGEGSSNPTINLFRPSAVVLDGEKYLFIVDRGNHRIVGSGLNGFRCLVGCGGWGSQTNQLSSPTSFSFDRSGNMFVVDSMNNRIEKFVYLESCLGKEKRSSIR